jgi:hypothetical protein
MMAYNSIIISEDKSSNLLYGSQSIRKLSSGLIDPQADTFRDSYVEKSFSRIADHLLFKGAWEKAEQETLERPCSRIGNSQILFSKSRNDFWAAKNNSRKNWIIETTIFNRASILGVGNHHLFSLINSYADTNKIIKLSFRENLQDNNSQILFRSKSVTITDGDQFDYKLESPVALNALLNIELVAGKRNSGYWAYCPVGHILLFLTINSNRILGFIRPQYNSLSF